MSSSITITYELNPPLGVDAGVLSPSKTQDFQVKGALNNQTVFYTALHQAILEAKSQVGEELTAWRDVVGKAELSKETKKTLKYEEAEDEEEDEDEEQT